VRVIESEVDPCEIVDALIALFLAQQEKLDSLIAVRDEELRRLGTEL
jgi:hypothetical protein